MRRSVTTTVLAALTAGALVTVATAAGASGAPFDNSSGYWTSSNGTGSAHSTGTTSNDGTLTASSDATGGTKYLVAVLKLGPYSTPASGSSRTYVSDGVGVQEGDYEVKITYSGADTDEITKGSGVAQGRVYSETGFFGPGGYGESVSVGTSAAELPNQPGTVVLSYVVHVPEDGQLSATAGIQALSSANKPGNSATTTSRAVVSDLSFTRLG